MLEDRRDLHYLRRPGNVAVRRTRWRRGILNRVLLLAVQVVLLAGLYLVGRQIYLAAITSPSFNVRTIAVRGNVRTKTADLVALASSALSKNIFRVDLDALSADLSRSPWVLTVSVRRSLPSTIEVNVTERGPEAIASFDGRSYLVDGTGRILAAYTPGVSDFDFPVLTGLERIPRAQATERIRAGAAAVSLLRTNRPELARWISEIDLSSPDRLILHPADGSPVLYLSNDDPLRNLEHYDAIRSMIPGSIPAREGDAQMKIASVDLRYRGRIAVMPEPSQPSTAVPGSTIERMTSR